MSGKSPLELLNIVPMLPEHREELAADTLDLLRRGCINRTAFILTLVPEGNPPADKAKVLGERFEQFRAALGKTDMPVGILIQATIGHGWVPNTPSEFQRIVLPDGERPYMFCPLDEAFRACIGDAVRRLADGRKGLRKKVVQRFTGGQTIPELLRLCAELLVRELAVGILQRHDGVDGRLQLLDLTLGARAE